VGISLEHSQKTENKIAGTAIIVMISIIASRFTGFIRETLVPNFIGVNELGDSYNIAFTITGLMYNLLIGGAIAAALIPVLSGYIAKDEEKEGWLCVSTFVNVLFIATVFVCTLGMIFAPFLVRVIAGGFTDPDQIALTVSLVRILFPSVALLMLTGLANGVLNSYRRFVASAFGPSIYNLGSSVSIVLFGRNDQNIKLIAYGIVATSFLYFLLQLFFTSKNLNYYRFRIDLKHPGFRKLFKLAIPSLIASSVVQVNILIISSFASFLESGTVTAYNIADRTWQMPYGIFAQGLGIAMLPSISAMFALNQMDHFKQTIKKALRFIAYMIIPCSIIFIFLRVQIISTIFQFTNRFGDDNVLLTANILGFFSFAMLSQSVVTLLNRVFYATNDTKTPLYTGLTTVGVIFLLCLFFIHLTSFEASGLALAYTISSIINALLLYSFLAKKIGSINLHLKSFILQQIVPCFVMSLFLFFANRYLFSSNFTKIMQFIQLSWISGLAFLLYFVSTMLFRVDEANYMKEKMIHGIKKILPIGIK
jgi:putative peptidoglycan lipid II flippase